MYGRIAYIVLVLAVQVLTKNTDSILKYRQDLYQKQLDAMLGSDIVLSDIEEKANDIIMDLKRQEVDYGFNNPNYFNISKHFFEYKDKVKESPLFGIIQNMPKGAVLHAHDTGLLNPDYVLSFTYWDHLFVCFYNGDVQFLFSNTLPKEGCAGKWQLMSDARTESGNVKEFDAGLRKYFTMVVDDPVRVYPDINAAWDKFTNYFIVTTPLLSYKPAWKKYFYDTLKAFRDDNVMYIEVRSVLPYLYDLDGNIYNAVDTAVAYKEVLVQFMNDYPDFFGAKLIQAPSRYVDSETIKEYIKTAKLIKERLPDFYAGFDLVGQEDPGVPLKNFLPDLAEASNDIDFFFHAGETNWYGTDTDENLYDAIALGTKRIGHAFAIIKHQELIKEIIKRDIALEVNVISNNILRLIEDIRNHPLASFLAQGLPVVLSSDDPGVWEASPMSHDYYVTFIAVASRHADLKLLKKLALNSLVYSTAPNKHRMIEEFEKRWAKFAEDLVLNNNKLYNNELDCGVQGFEKFKQCSNML